MEFYQHNEVLVSMIVFFLGFTFDIYTIQEIDNLLGLIQQAIYLVALGTLLILEIRVVAGTFTLSERGKKFWEYHNLIVHFLFGSLLSLYTIFYFTSASAITSFFFILLLAGLMLANEFPKIRSLGLPIRTTLYSICTLSYFSFFYPILLGKIGPVPFWLGFLSSCLVLILIWMFNFRGLTLLQKKVFLPAALVHLFFIIGYYTSLIPPVPVAVKKIGAYYEVIKENNQYIGTHTKSGWDFGTKEFLTRPGDKVTILLSIFSPAHFHDRVFLKWFFKDETRGWQLEDSIPLSILGGRKEGFRGFGSKQFYKLGKWRVLVETSDGREVGRINLEIKADPSIEERKFKFDIY
jgi:hypothetical protein